MNSRYLISLSGGGYRAALFNAGVLRTLHEADILRPNFNFDRQHVLVNAVSGGAISSEVWNRFLRSEEYYSDKDTLVPEKALIDLVGSSPGFFGRFNWHFRGCFFGAQVAWYNHFDSWWRNLKLNEMRREPLGDMATYVSPGKSQCYPVFMFETIDVNDGSIIAFHEGRYFKTDSSFFEKGNFFDSIAEGLPASHGVVAATAFPVFFPKVSIGGSKLIDAGLVDNQALYNFHPLLKKPALGSGDTWFLSNAGRNMRIVSDPRVERLSFMDKFFRLTGDLAQPKMNDVIMDIVKSGLGCKVCGVHMPYSHLEEPLWFKSDRIREAMHSANFPTTLSYIGRADAIALISHGAQCAANAISVSVTIKKRLISIITRLETEAK